MNAGNGCSLNNNPAGHYHPTIFLTIHQIRTIARINQDNIGDRLSTYTFGQRFLNISAISRADNKGIEATIKALYLKASPR